MLKCFLLCLIPFLAGVKKTSKYQAEQAKIIIQKKHNEIRSNEQVESFSLEKLTAQERDWVERKVWAWFKLIPKDSFELIPDHSIEWNEPESAQDASRKKYAEFCAGLSNLIQQEVKVK